MTYPPVSTPWLTVVLAGCLLLACRDAEPGAEEAVDSLELIEVDGGPASALVPDQDEVAPRSAPRLVGQLPGDFPQGLPVYLPASIVDMGEVGGGSNHVVLSTADSAQQVRRWLQGKIEASTWSRQTDESNTLRVTDGETVATYSIERGERGNTLIRISYRR